MTFSCNRKKFHVESYFKIEIGDSEMIQLVKVLATKLDYLS